MLPGEGLKQEDMEVVWIAKNRPLEDIDYCAAQDREKGTRLIEQGISNSIAAGLLGRAREDLGIA